MENQIDGGQFLSNISQNDDVFAILKQTVICAYNILDILYELFMITKYFWKNLNPKEDTKMWASAILEFYTHEVINYFS